MITILLCTHSETVLEHWRESLVDAYNNIIQIKSENGLKKCLEKNEAPYLLLDSNYFINVSEYISSILDTNDKTKILFMDDTPSFKKGKELLPLGIKAYGNSRMSSIHLQQVLSVTSEGNVWLYPDFIQEMIQEMTGNKEKEQTDFFKTLTKKERLIAKHVAKGKSNKEIASDEGIYETTVKVHLRSIYKKLKVNDRLSLALLFK